MTEFEKIVKEHETMVAERMTFVKLGPNVLHLEYYSSLLDSDPVQELDMVLNSSGLELSRFDRTGMVYNNIDAFSLTVFFVITQPLVQELMKGVAINAVWDGVKYSIIKLALACQGKEITKLNGGKVTKEKLRFGVEIRRKSGGSIKFDMSAGMDADLYDRFFSSALEIVQTIEGKGDLYAKIDQKSNSWKPKSIEAEIRKKIERTHTKKKRK